MEENFDFVSLFVSTLQPSTHFPFLFLATPITDAKSLKLQYLGIDALDYDRLSLPI
jgi:hypothetical protein